MPSYAYIISCRLLIFEIKMALSARAVEYPDFLSAEGYPHPTNKYSVYDTKQSNGDAPIMLELWEMRNTHLLPSVLGPLMPGVVTPDRVLSMGQIELFSHLNPIKPNQS